MGLVTDIKRFAVHDGPGIRTTVFLKGCPLRCLWCHNPEGIAPYPQLSFNPRRCIGCGKCAKVCPNKAHTIGADGHVLLRDRCAVCGKCADVCLGGALTLYGRERTAEDVMAEVREDAPFYAGSSATYTAGGATVTLPGGMTLSGGEPLLQPEFALALLRAAKAEGIGTAVDTCACVPWSAFEPTLSYTDIYLVDCKHIDPEAHRRLTGRSNAPILDNLRRLAEAGARVEVRIPLVPGANDGCLDEMGAFLGALPILRVRVLPYHSLARSKYEALGMADTMPCVDAPDDASLARAVSILRAHGLDALSARE